MSLDLADFEHRPIFQGLSDVPFYSIDDGEGALDAPVFENLGELVSVPRAFVGPGYRSANRMITRIFPNGYKYGLRLDSAQELIAATVSPFGANTLILGANNFPITDPEDPYYWIRWARNTGGFPFPTLLGTGIVCSDEKIMIGTYSVFGLRCARTERFGLGVVVDPRAHGGVCKTNELNDNLPDRTWRRPRRMR